MDKDEKRYRKIDSTGLAISSKRKYLWDDLAWRPVFLAEFRLTGMKLASCEAAEVTLPTVAKARELDPEFEEDFQNAITAYKESLEVEAHRRAVEGWDEPVFSPKFGEAIGSVRKYDSRLLETLLRANIPEKFGDRVQHDHKVSGGVLVVPAAPVSLEDWSKQYGSKAAGDFAKPAQELEHVPLDKS